MPIGFRFHSNVAPEWLDAGMLQSEKLSADRESRLDRMRMPLILWPAHAVAQNLRAFFEALDNGLADFSLVKAQHRCEIAYSTTAK